MDGAERRSRSRHAVTSITLVLLVACGLVACSEDDGTVETSGGSAGTTDSTLASTSTDTSVSSPTTSPTTVDESDVPADGTTTVALYPPFSCETGDPFVAEDGLLLVPVLYMIPEGGCDATSNLVRGPSGEYWNLGPPLPAGMLESARVMLDPGGLWVIEAILNVGSPGIDDLNAIAPSCVSMAPECPTGQLAIVIDGELVSAPGIQQTEYERDAIYLSGDFTEAEARAAADAIS